jgi:hypothetical protein
MRLGEWPGFVGLRIVMLWVILVLVVFGWRHYWGVARAVADEGTVAPFSFVVPILVAFGPPLFLAIVYSVWRRRRSGRP